MFFHHTTLLRGNIMLTLAVVALCAVGFTLSIMAWEYRNDNANLQEHIERLERSREEMRRKIKTTEKPAVESVGPVRIAQTSLSQPRTNEEKREALQSLLDDPNASELSARAIARKAGVSKTMVLNVLKEKAEPRDIRPQRITKQTALGKQKGRRVRPTKYPRAFISKEVDEWMEVAPRAMLAKALTNLLLNKRDYIQYNKRFDTWSVTLSQNYRAYTTGPFDTRHEAREFRRRLFIAVSAREDSNA